MKIDDLKDPILTNEFADFYMADKFGVVVSKEESTDVLSLSPKSLASIFQIIKDAKELINYKFKPDGLSIEWSIGKCAGQQSDRPFVTILPRYNTERYAGDNLTSLLEKIDNKRDEAPLQAEFVDDFADFLA